MPVRAHFFGSALILARPTHFVGHMLLIAATLVIIPVTISFPVRTKDFQIEPPLIHGLGGPPIDMRFEYWFFLNGDPRIDVARGMIKQALRPVEWVIICLSLSFFVTAMVCAALGWRRRLAYKCAVLCAFIVFTWEALLVGLFWFRMDFKPGVPVILLMIWAMIVMVAVGRLANKSPDKKAACCDMCDGGV